MSKNSVLKKHLLGSHAGLASQKVTELRLGFVWEVLRSASFQPQAIEEALR